MSKPFDPYHKWLGIHPEEQPPHHYRLLGVTLFESDPDVIDSAADQRSVHVRSFQTGPHAAESQKLLNEIAVARRCLLSAAERLAYDQKLRAAQATPPSARPLPVLPLPVASLPVAQPLAVPPRAAPSPVPAIPVSPAPTSSLPLVVPSRAPRKKAAVPVGLLAAGGAVAALAGVVITAVLLSRGDREEVARAANTNRARPISASSPEQQPTPSRTSDQPVATPSDDAAPSPDPVDLSSEPVGPAVSSSESSVSAAPSPAEPPSTVTPSDTKPIAADPPAPTPPSPEPPAIDYAALFAPPADRRLPIPDAEAKKAADRQIDDVYGDDFKAARTPPQKQALATRLLDTARETANQPTLRFALLERARTLAVAAGDSDTAVEAVELQAADFQVDGSAESAEVLAGLQKKVKLPAQQSRIARQALQVANKALAAENFAAAAEAAQAGAPAAMKADYGELAKQLRQAAADAKEMEQQFRRAKAAAQQLSENQEDSESDHREAKDTLGTYLCLYRNDWQRGLPLLAAGADGPLQKLARRDLQAPTSPDAQLLLGDRWWGAAQERAGIVQRCMQSRAARWYEPVLPSLTGSTRDQVARRLLASRPLPARVEFRNPQSLQQFVLAEGSGRKWLVDRGFLRIEGGGAHTTYAKYYKSISSVTIRGGIESLQGRNFRVSVGPLNMILNWEGGDQNHYRLGESYSQPKVTQPHALLPGRIEEITVRQEGDDVVVDVNGQRQFFAAGTLEGTITVYPASSPIIVQEILIDGEADPTRRVTGPSHQNLY